MGKESIVRMKGKMFTSIQVLDLRRKGDCQDEAGGRSGDLCQAVEMTANFISAESWLRTREHLVAAHTFAPRFQILC